MREILHAAAATIAGYVGDALVWLLFCAMDARTFIKKLFKNKAK